MASVVAQSSSGYGLPIAVSVALHVVLVVLVAWGWESSTPPQHRVTPKYVEAKLVTLKPKVEKKVAPKKPKTVNLAEKRRQQQLREKARQKKLAEERRKKAAQKKAREKKAREKREREKKLAAEKAAKKKEQERLERERKAAEERRRLAEQQRLQQEAAFAEALAAEEAQLAEEAQATEAQSYIGAIAAMIEQNWSRPPSARRGMQCELSIQLIPTGEVIHVSVVKSSGNAAFDRAAEQAVKKAGRFDVLKDVPPVMFDKYFRQLRLRFNPQDLRL